MYRIYDYTTKRHLPGLWSTYATADAIRMGRVLVLGQQIYDYGISHTRIGCRW